MKTGGLYDIEGEQVVELLPLEGEQDIEFLLDALIAYTSIDDQDAQAELQRLLTAFKDGVRVTLSFQAVVVATNVPYTLDANSNRQPFRRIGNMYFLCYEGVLQGAEKKHLLPMGPGGKPEAIFAWCCLAAS